MRRQSQEEVAAAARRRLDLLRRELEQAGLRRVDDPADDPADHPADDPADDPAEDEVSGNPSVADGDPSRDRSSAELPAARAIIRAGRHARPGGVGRLAEWSQGLVPEALRGRVGLGGGPVLLVVLMVAVACVVTGVAVMRMGGHDGQVAAPTTGATPLVSTAPGSTATGSAAPTAGSASSAATPAAAGAARTVTVDVAGKVQHPGVRTLPVGSRVVDALRRAGGARGGVDLTGLNLARVLVDGEQILVGRAAVPGGLAASSSATAPPATAALVNLNTATEEQLDTLPGVGPVTAQKILQWRTSHGAFSAVDELLEVDGIGEKTLADLAPLVTL